MTRVVLYKIISGLMVATCLAISVAQLSCGSKMEYAELEGDVFVVTKARENLKLGLVQILVCETGSNAPTYPTEFVANTVTNSDGKFRVQLQMGTYRLFATATRSIPFGNAEKYEWVVDITLVSAHQTIILSNHNLSAPDKWPESLRKP